MAINLLILGGTAQARCLADAVAAAQLRATVSYAGRVKHLRCVAVPHRVGGFGGIAGLQAYLEANAITHLVDATHPFAVQMSRHAVAACARTGVPMVALTRPQWSPQCGDTWQTVADIDAAVAALSGPAERIFLAIGRMHIAAFAAQPQHHYTLRLVEPPQTPPPLPRHRIVIARGPFTVDGDSALLKSDAITRVVAKNSGGRAAAAKIEAARHLGVPVLMIDRPPQPRCRQMTEISEVMAWLHRSGTDLGV